MALGQPRQRLDQAHHAPLHAPQAELLHVRDEQQRRGRERGRAADIGREAPHRLAQPRIAQMRGDGVGEQAEGRERHQPPHADLRRKAERGGAVGAEEGPLQRLEHAPRAGEQFQVAARLGHAGEAAHPVSAGLRAERQIERAAVGPEVAAEMVHAAHRHLVGKARAGARKHLVEHVKQRQQHRAGGDAHTGRQLRLGDLAAQDARALQHHHLPPRGGELHRRDEAAHPGADHDHAPGSPPLHATHLDAR